MSARLFVLAVLLLLFACLSAFADDCPITGVGGAIRPMKEHPSIEMERMHVVVDMYPEHARVDCHFVFHNTGPATRVRMGFPESAQFQPRGQRPVGFTSFATWVDGKRYRARIEGFTSSDGGSFWRRWRVKQVVFGRDQRRTVRVKYTAPLGSIGGGPTRAFIYEVSTGASWKGPIGQVRVQLRTHYDHNHGWAYSRDPLRRVDSNTWEWVQQCFEPQQDTDDLFATYFPGYIGIEAHGLDAFPAVAPYPYMRDGETWASIYWAAKWLNVRMLAHESGVGLVRGSQVVSLRAGDPWLNVNGQRVKLSGAPYVTRGRLMAPLRPIAVALGGTVRYDPKTRDTDISFADEGYVEGVLRYTPNPNVYVFFLPEGYAPPSLTEYSKSVQARYAGGGQPWMCVGDFDGAGREQAAVVLQRGREWEICVWGMARQREGGEPYMRSDVHPDGRIKEKPAEVVLRTRPPGTVQCYRKGEASPTGTLELRHDGIELVTPGKRTVLYYWDAEMRGFRQVTVAPAPGVEEAKP